MAIRSWPGQDGIRIPESGLAGRISRSDLDLVSAGGAAGAGAGGIGASIGMTDIRGMAAEDIIPGAERFITGTISIAADPGAVGPNAAERSAAGSDVAKPDVAKYSTTPVARLNLSK